MQKSSAVLGPVERSLEASFDAPEGALDGLELRSDHGPQDTGSDCEKLCHDWHVAHTFAPVGRPTGTAAAERFIQPLEVELIWMRDWRSEAELARGNRSVVADLQRSASA